MSRPRRQVPAKPDPGDQSSIVPVLRAWSKNFVQSGTINNVLDAAGDNSGRGGQLAEGMAVKLGVPMVYKILPA